MLVRNVPHGVVKLPAGFKSWLEFWQAYTGKRKDKCAFLACPYEGTVGVVVEAKGYEGVYYVIIECHSCSQFSPQVYYPASERAMISISDPTNINAVKEQKMYMELGSGI